jgi:hypothetical protein
MATINQSPAGQASVTLSGIGFDEIEATGTPSWQSRKIVGSPSVTLSGIGFDEIEATGTPSWQSRKIVGSPSVAVSLGGTPEPPGPTIPTTGQIWPLGIPIAGT